MIRKGWYLSWQAFKLGLRTAFIDTLIVLGLLLILLTPSQIFGTQLFELLYDLPATRIASEFTPLVQGWEPQIIRWAETYQLEPNVVALLMQQQSCGHPEALLSHDRYGLFGVRGDAFRPGDNLYDPDTNARLGLSRFSSLMEETDGDLGMSFVIYTINEHPGEDVEKWSPEATAIYAQTMGFYQALAEPDKRGVRSSLFAMVQGETGEWCVETTKPVAPFERIRPRVLLEMERAVHVTAYAFEGTLDRILSQSSDHLPLAALNRIEDAIFRAQLSGDLAPIFTEDVYRWERQIYAWSETYGVEPNVIATLMQIESCGNPYAVSRAGALGLFQVMPFHFKDGEDAFDPDTNARRGLTFFVERRAAARGNLGLAFAQYNGGMSRLNQPFASWPAETQEYYRRATNIMDDIVAGRDQSKTISKICGAGSGAPEGRHWLVSSYNWLDRLWQGMGNEVEQFYIGAGIPVERPRAFEFAQSFFLTVPFLVQGEEPLAWNGGARDPVTGKSNSNAYCLVAPSRPIPALAPITPYRITSYHTRRGHGIHGCNYNNPGVDFGAVGGIEIPLFAPITGTVERVTYDEWGNSVLKIENASYIVYLLHGKYEGYVKEGDAVLRGRTRVGYQASIGNSSGPHTHFSVYDKAAGGWIDPFAVITLTPPPSDIRFSPIRIMPIDS